MQQENHTRQELEVEWKGIDGITETPDLGKINKDCPVQLKPLLVGFLWNNLGNNLTPFGLKHCKYPLETWHWEREKSRLAPVTTSLSSLEDWTKETPSSFPCFLLILLQSSGHYII